MTQRVGTLDLVKGRTYYATFDFHGFGGKPVTLRTPSRNGKHAIVVTEDGKELSVHPAAWLFAEDPRKAEK